MELEYTEFSNDDLTAMLVEANESKSPLLKRLIPSITAELASRVESAERAENTESLRMLADNSAQMLSDIGASKVTSVAKRDGQAYKRQASSLVALIEAAYDVSTLRAQRAVKVLTDEKQRAGDTVKTVSSAVDYVLAHAKSTIYTS